MEFIIAASVIGWIGSVAVLFNKGQTGWAVTGIFFGAFFPIPWIVAAAVTPNLKELARRERLHRLDETRRRGRENAKHIAELKAASSNTSAVDRVLRYVIEVDGASFEAVSEALGVSHKDAIDALNQLQADGLAVRERGGVYRGSDRAVGTASDVAVLNKANEPTDTIDGRLETIDRLLREEKITAEEHSDQRRVILRGI